MSWPTKNGLSDSMGPLLTVDEVAELLRTSRATVYNLARQGRIPGAQIGKSWRFNRKAIEKWMRRREPDQP
jgi:excisionase family DNA binding protein